MPRRRRRRSSRQDWLASSSRPAARRGARDHPGCGPSRLGVLLDGAERRQQLVLGLAPATRRDEHAAIDDAAAAKDRDRVVRRANSSTTSHHCTARAKSAVRSQAESMSQHASPTMTRSRSSRSRRCHSLIEHRYAFVDVPATTRAGALLREARDLEIEAAAPRVIAEGSSRETNRRGRVGRHPAPHCTSQPARDRARVLGAPFGAEQSAIPVTISPRAET